MGKIFTKSKKDTDLCPIPIPAAFSPEKADFADSGVVAAIKMLKFPEKLKWYKRSSAVNPLPCHVAPTHHIAKGSRTAPTHAVWVIC